MLFYFVIQSNATSSIQIEYYRLQLSSHQSSLYSMSVLLKERDLKKLYKPPPQQDYTDNYKRLIIVIVISFLFIAAELFAGIYAHSIAIISDAIHLISDTVGFFFSFLFLYLSKWPPNPRMTFGYHRMQLLGAIANIFIIWILILFVVYESTNRIINRAFVEDPMIMLITSIGGFFVNLVMFKVLHHGKHHSHGLLSNEHGHEHMNHGHKHNKQEVYHKCSLSYDKPVSKENIIIRVSKSQIEQGQINRSEYSCTQDICKKEEYNSNIGEIHSHKNNIIHRHVALSDPAKKKHQLNKNNKSSSSIKKKAKIARSVNIQSNLVEHLIPDKYCEEECDSSSLDEDNQLQDKLIPIRNKHKHKEDDRMASIGMQAAVLHALSDMIMSLGLIISSLIIFLLGNPDKPYDQKVTEWNAWHLFDPIATYIFSVIALASTLPVVKNSYLLLMETTPHYIDLIQLKSKCEKVQGVKDIHDIHVWDLKPGKTCMMAHVLAKAGTERSVLVELSDIARQHKIFHSNFQVEEQEWKDDQSYILCDNDIH